MTWSRSLLMTLALALAHPSLAGTDAYARLIVNYGLVEQPAPDRFNVCHSHGCDGIATVGLTTEQWQQITGLFANKPGDATEERARIAQAIGRMEQLAGRLAGTADDRGGNFNGFGRLTAQQDCVDESTNSTTYLTLIAENDLLYWHTVRGPAMRGFIFRGWPHLTAVIVEKKTGKEWAVDSWFKANGEPPLVMTVADWYQYRRGAGANGV